MKGRFTLTFLLAAAMATLASAEEPKHRQLAPVPSSDVKLHDAFWAPRIPFEYGNHFRLTISSLSSISKEV